MKLARAAFVSFMLAALVGVASYACPADALVLVGASGTTGLGEVPLAIEARGEYGIGPLRLEAAWSGADKIESRAGWLARAAVEARLGPLGIGAAYSYRDGGAWVKHYPWARLSIGNDKVRLIVERVLGGYNRETKLEARSYARHERFVAGFGVFVERHIQGTGFGSSLMVGIGG